MKLTNRHLGVLQWAVNRVTERAASLISAPAAERQNHMAMINDANQALMIIRAGNGQLSVTESQRLIQERDDAVAKLAKATDNVQEVHRNLQSAVWRIQDMLMGDDGRAFKEAQRFLERPAVAKLRAPSMIPSLSFNLRSTDLRHLKTQAMAMAAMYDESKASKEAGAQVDVAGGLIVSRHTDPETQRVVWTCHSDLVIKLSAKQLEKARG